MVYTKDISLIVPHRNSVGLLKKLFNSIPLIDAIEIILVDNSPNKISKSDIETDREYTLIYSDPNKGAGGARNAGIEYSHGKWLIFADADDYFTSEAFEIFCSKIDSDSDIIFTGMKGIYLDTGEASNRGAEYVRMIRDYLQGTITEDYLKYRFFSPCCKMIKHDLVNSHIIKFDEVLAGNDVYFSMLCGHYSKKIEVIDAITYIATVSKGTLTKRRDIKVVESRFFVALRYNKFLRDNGKSRYQISIMHYLQIANKCGFKYMFRFFVVLFKYKQNPFIGWKNWLRTAKEVKIRNKIDKKYFVK